ncbi:DUF3035 domain-containing protein [Hwanghaeella sp.]|uniref:DUF3035 domain-containing protein n=1 Tax=Hwanghaeella sp. TaxID=2605943 RepID=UPI003CCB9F61
MVRISRKIGVSAAIAASLLLAGCESNLGNLFGYQRGGPDEFSVVKRAPLTLPPDFGLRAPDPGADELNRITPRATARAALVGNSLTPRQQQRLVREKVAQGNSPSEVALLAKANALNADPEIRQIVDDESASLARENEGFVDDLLFWKEKKLPGDVVDPEGESKRLQENSSLGRPVTEGDTPTITTQKEEPLFKWPF